MALSRVPNEKAIHLELVRPIAVVDLETTGTSPSVDRIIEIGILKVKPLGEQVRFRWRVNPGVPIPKEASEIHRLRDEDVKDKPKFKAIARNVLNFIRGCDLVGFNLKNFDLPMLQAEFQRAGVEFSYSDRHVIDVKDIYHYHEGRALCDAVKFYCNSTHKEAHSALEDACATWRVLQAQIEMYGLPTSASELSDFMEIVLPRKTVDSGGWFSRRDGNIVLAKGKHKGESLSRIAREHPDYLDWILRLDDLPKDTEQIIREQG